MTTGLLKTEVSIGRLLRAEDDIKKSWSGSFTSPKAHDENNFCYLVYAYNRFVQPRLKVIARKYGEKLELNYVDLLKHPELIITRPTISASVINQDHTDTFANVGYILKTPTDNILAVSPEDMGTFVKDVWELEQLRRERSIRYTVNELIKASDGLNEVVVAGETEAGKTEIVGIFYRCYRDSDWNPIGAKHNLNTLNAMRRKLPEVPVVKIFEPEPYQRTEAEPFRNLAHEFCGLALNYKGKRYVAQFHDYSSDEFSKTKYVIIDRDSRFRMMTRAELEQMLGKAKDYLSEENRKLVEAKSAEVLGAYAKYGTRGHGNWMNQISTSGGGKERAAYLKLLLG